MVEKLRLKLSMQRRNSVTLEIRETNVVAQLFFRAMGYKAVSVLRDYYEDTDEDAYVMQYRVRQGDVAKRATQTQTTKE